MNQSTNTPERLEKIIRTTAVELGLTCASSTNPLPGSAIKAHGIPNTLSQAWYLGRAVHLARRNKASYVDAIVSLTFRATVSLFFETCLS